MTSSFRAACAGLLLAGAFVGCGSDDAATSTGMAAPGAVPPTAVAPATTAPVPTGTTSPVPDAPPAARTPDPETETTVSDDDQPILCPSARYGQAGGGTFDARELVGATVEQASATARRHGCAVRVAREDGTDLPRTQDYVSSRINVAVTDGRVTGILGVN